MTRQQIADSLEICLEYVNSCFQVAQKEHPYLEHDSKDNKKGCGTDYTLEEVLLAMSYFRDGKGLSDLEKAIIEDEFTMRKPEVKAIGIPGTEEFIEKIKKYPKKKCCSTCAYCTKSTIRNSKPVPKPYCNLWDRYLNKIHADPYNDYCRQWEYSNKEPLIFYAHNSPTNVDIYGNVKNEVMGFDVSCFGKSDGSVKLVTDIGLEKEFIG